MEGQPISLGAIGVICRMYDQQHAQHIVWNATSQNIPDIARAFVHQARAPYHALAAVLATNDPGASANARAIIAQSTDLPIGPIIDMDLSKTTPSTRMIAIRSVLNAEIALRQGIVTWLETLLDDKARIELPPGTLRPEVPSPIVRVCDEAFVALREMLYFGEDPAVQERDGDGFLDMPFTQRDMLIERARSSRAYRLATGDYVPEPDPETWP